MSNHRKFYINGQWVEPTSAEVISVINPATEAVCAEISSGTAEDVDHAVCAAQQAFVSYSKWDVAQRMALLQRIHDCYMERYDDLAEAITMTMGSPITPSRKWQVGLGRDHIKTAMQSLAQFEFETTEGDLVLTHEPIGVCGLITPWNWPMSLICVKVMPALAAGCTVVLKPSEESPIDAVIFTEILHKAGVPAGVFNLVQGYGAVVGEAMSSHPGIDMMSFTGSTRSGIAVTKASADSVKRVGLELGGKSANIILDDTNISDQVKQGVRHMMGNSGQSCNAPTRMLVPNKSMDIAIEAAAEAVGEISVDDPSLEGDHLGPVVNRSQFERIQSLIQTGIDEGARLVAGGLGRPEPFSKGYFVKPTVFAEVDNDMTIAQEEIFGPVITLLGYEDDEHAVEIANDTPYGLAGYVSGNDMTRARAIAKRLRAGQVAINYVGGGSATPFGGYKQSGNGRERGRWGLMEFLELKAITGAVN